MEGFILFQLYCVTQRKWLGRVQDESKSEFLATLMGSISPGKLAVRETEMMPERKLGKLFTLSRKKRNNVPKKTWEASRQACCKQKEYQKGVNWGNLGSFSLFIETKKACKWKLWSKQQIQKLLNCLPFTEAGRNRAKHCQDVWSWVD